MLSVVIGASGGIGSALAAGQEAQGRKVLRLSRREHGLDLADEDSIAAAAARLDGELLDRLIVATGLLHDEVQQPERALKQLDAQRLLRSFAVNAVGPALILKHFAPLLPRDQTSVIALLSARVGSIADNRLGGWYGYRASKAALNQLVRTAAIEVARTRALATIVALHPGTVNTALSEPFQKGVPAEQLFTPEQAAIRLLEVIDRVGPAQNGGFFDYKGEPIPF